MSNQNHFMPFLWVHGEEAAVYREMIKAIDEANIKSFCVESRPHEFFLEEKWWQDLDVIIDEAKKRSMSFYILDDKHFPTGYANGAAEKAPNELRRQSLFSKVIPVKKGEKVSVKPQDYCKFTPTFNELGALMNQYMNNESVTFDDDRLLSATFYGKKSFSALADVNLQDTFEFEATEDGEIYLCFLTRNAGIHRNYINMLEPASVRLLIDEVYESHWDHYKDEFGKTILGFFSDEPELGNSSYTNARVDLGDDPNLDLPFSDSLDKKLIQAMGNDYKHLLPLLWKKDFDADLTSKVRYEFMTTLTNLLSESFSKQIGDWCRQHGVSYIGHVIEDNNLHSKTGTSLGHYFKGLKYQSMSGIDDIGGQVYPFCEESNDFPDAVPERDGIFYHYCLGKLASSLASVNPAMDGDSMCEVFGNYGWHEGVKLEKYLLDHFMVRGVNNFVPHAFSCAPYPDSDCPPHFYAHGHNPQYRHFGELMKYGQKICDLISGGYIDAKVAILYHAEAEWCGKRMLVQEPAKLLYDNQIDYTFVPAEVFEERTFYKTAIDSKLHINKQSFDLFVIPFAERIPASVADGIVKLLSQGGKVVFIDGLPSGTCEGDFLPMEILACPVVALDQLADVASNLATVTLAPANDRVRVLHYIGDHDVYFIVNEGRDAYTGTVTLLNGTSFETTLSSCNSLLIVDGVMEEMLVPSKDATILELKDFEIKACKAIDYPAFTDVKIDDSFSGIISYETSFNLNKNTTEALLEITDAYEGVEVFLNNISLGIKLVAPFKYDLSKAMLQGENTLRIEVATTLQRERRLDPSMAAMVFGMPSTPPEPDPIGITGEVKIYYK